MPCPHFNITITLHSKNQSAVAGTAYQSGEAYFSQYDQKRKSYSEKRALFIQKSCFLLIAAGI